MTSSPPQRPSGLALVGTALVRDIVSHFPHVTERVSHGEAAWFINDKKNFVAMRDHHHDDRVSVVLAAAAGVQAALTSDDPRTYFVPAYVGSRGWIGIYLDGRDTPMASRDVLGSLLRDAWLLVAPSKLHSELSDL